MRKELRHGTLRFFSPAPVDIATLRLVFRSAALTRLAGTSLSLESAPGNIGATNVLITRPQGTGAARLLLDC